MNLLTNYHGLLTTTIELIDCMAILTIRMMGLLIRTARFFDRKSYLFTRKDGMKIRMVNTPLSIGILLTNRSLSIIHN